MGRENMKISLFYNHSTKIRGCYKVAYDTIRGLEKLGHEVVHNQVSEINGCIQYVQGIHSLPRNTLIGPEIMVTPNEKPEMWKFKKWAQPSAWVWGYMKKFPIIKGVKRYVWPVGIDSERFIPNNTKKIFNCLVYYKDVTKQTPPSKLEYVKTELDQLGLTYKVITYGDYEEAEYIKTLHECECAIWLVGTESQNIALMELLSCNIPVYVIDQREFMYRDFIWMGASSAPYFDERCGVKCNSMLDFQKFYERLNDYAPREYILDNHTLEKGAQKYVDILEDIHGN